jgi:hypothetical protein
MMRLVDSFLLAGPQRITARVVRAALDVDLLVRGGLSQGRLYHRGRVVIGEAMVDAYRLERCVAACARVAVSPRIPDKEGLFIDTDGTRCLDFFTELMLTQMKCTVMLWPGRGPSWRELTRS